ncbi:STAS domain-containing protein [Spirochaeta dissipatitropha]
MVQIKKNSARSKRIEVSFSGRLVFSEIRDIYEKLAGLISLDKELRIDLDKIDGIDLAGYQLLLSLSRTISEEKIPCVVKSGSCAERLSRMSEFTGLPKPFGALETEEQ